MKRWLVLLTVLAVSSALPQIKPMNCIKNCKCLEILPNILDVTECDRPLVLNATIFENLDKRIITVISLSNVVIKEIKQDAFKEFTRLEDVIIEKSQIGAIGPKVFNKVRKVKFADCSFAESPALYSENLEELHFGNCQLDEIPPLDELFALVFLNLSGNYIKDIEIESFVELFDLEVLILSNNELTRIPANLLVNNADLNSLYLDNNPLKFFHMNTSNKLETLSLKNCHLTTFDLASTYHLTSLSELNLANNKLSNLSTTDFARMGELSVLDLSNNSLTELGNDIFKGNPELQKVILDGNKFEALPNFTLENGKLFQIYFFSCKDCGLKIINKDVFKDMRSIVRLELSNNDISEIGDMLFYINSLKWLDISNNKIKVLAPHTFEHNRNLENLYMGGNLLNAIDPNVFVSTRALRKIDVSNNNMTKLWMSNNTVLDSLRKLIVSNNKIKSLEIENFQVVPNLQAIDLHHNPLIFDDNLCRVINWLERLSIYPIEYFDSIDNLDQTLSNDIDNMTINQWSEFHKSKCPTMSNDIDKHSEDEDFIINRNDNDNTSGNENEDENNIDDSDEEYDDDDYDEENYNDDEKDDRITAEIVEDENINLARASNILYFISVFVLTALAVLIIAVTATLFILRRNSNFNMHQANLPRLKIPLWDGQPATKKHSGSVYRPLSEDLSGPKTPKCSRYEFKAQPTVHTIHT